MFIVIKKRFFILLLCFCLLIVFSGITYCGVINVSGNIPAQNFCVVLDAGHGGIDGGSQGKSGVYERDLNLIITNKIEKWLNTMGIIVIQTRRTQEGLYGVFASGFKMRDMKERKRIIEQSNANLVVSVHMNYYTDNIARGAQVFYKPNNEISEALANNMQNLFINNLEQARKMTKEGDFYILTCTNTPGILVECGYLSNYEEEKLLLSEEYQNLLSYQIFCGIVTFFDLM